MKKNIIFSVIGIVILLLSITAAMALIKTKPMPPKDGKRENLLTVKTAAVEYGNLATSFSYQGRVEALENVSLAAEVNGKIMQGDIPFKEGQTFAQNDLLIKIYSKDAEANIKASRSNFLRTLSQILPDMLVDYPESYPVWNDFFNSITLDAPLPEMPEIKQEKEKIFLASNGVLSEYYALKQQEITFEKYNIYAPFDGYFKQVNRQVGSIAGNSSELAVIVRSDALEVIAPVFPADAERVNINQTVEIESKSGKRYKGSVSRVAKFVDTSTQSVNTYIKYQRSAGQSLLEGEFVTVHFQNNSTTQGMQIPREALIDNQFVYVVENDKLQKAKIKIVQTLEDYVVITGLTKGAVLVTESLANVSEGQHVLVR